MEKVRVYVVIAVFEYDGSAIETKLIGTFKLQGRAFEALDEYPYSDAYKDCFDYADFEICNPYKEFGWNEEHNAYYSEYRKINSEHGRIGSIFTTIIEQEVE